MDIIKEKWEEILYTVKLEHELTDVSFDTWLKPLKVHSFEKNGSAKGEAFIFPTEKETQLPSPLRKFTSIRW